MKVIVKKPSKLVSGLICLLFGIYQLHSGKIARLNGLFNAAQTGIDSLKVHAGCRITKLNQTKLHADSSIGTCL